MQHGFWRGICLTTLFSACFCFCHRWAMGRLTAARKRLRQLLGGWCVGALFGTSFFLNLFFLPFSFYSVRVTAEGLLCWSNKAAETAGSHDSEHFLLSFFLILFFLPFPSTRYLLCWSNKVAETIGSARDNEHSNGNSASSSGSCPVIAILDH